MTPNDLWLLQYEQQTSTNASIIDYVEHPTLLKENPRNNMSHGFTK